MIFERPSVFVLRPSKVSHILKFLMILDHFSIFTPIWPDPTYGEATKRYAFEVELGVIRHGEFGVIIIFDSKSL